VSAGIAEDDAAVDYALAPVLERADARMYECKSDLKRKVVEARA
jgi:hypothetical protein